jgi:integrase
MIRGQSVAESPPSRNIANVQALAGHKSIKTTQRYLCVSTELRREAVNRLNFPETVPAE